MNAIASDGIDPFDALDVDWSALCRRQRRSGAVASWTAQEPCLEGMQSLHDVIPPPGVDRGPICAALARLQRTGDDLAGRALLQLCVPGLVYLAAKWRPRMPGDNTAAWEVVTRAAICISRLREGEIHCNVGVAGYLLRSVHRDLVQDARRDAQHRAQLSPDWSDDEEDDRPRDGRFGLAPSAEDVVCADHDVRAALEGATRTGVVPQDTARTLWLLLSGCSMSEASRFADRSIAAIYRHRSRVYAHLHQQLFLDGPTSQARLNRAGTQ